MTDLTGQTFGAYEIKEKLGQGGMGTVYKGYQPSVDRHVAIKVLPAAMTQESTFAARFTQEAKVIANLGHARILPVHDYGNEGGTLYLVMRYLDGGTVRERIHRDGLFEPAEAARIIRQVAEGLDFAHRQGVIHRDMTTNNIMFDSSGDAYITDFGLARLAEGTGQLTGSAIIGTPAFMSPEQGLGDPIDNRTDIYALGVVLYEMLLGEVPFDGPTPMVVVVKHINNPLPDPLSIRPDLHPAVAEVIQKATAKEPDDRFQSCHEMANALDAAVSGEAVKTAAAPPQEKAATSALAPASPDQDQTAKKRPGWILPAAGVGIVMILVVVAVLVFNPGRPEARVDLTPTASATSVDGAEPSSPPATQDTEADETDDEEATPLPSLPEVVDTEAPIEPGIAECPAGREAVLAYDFDASKPEGISLFEETGQVSLSLDETWLVMEPMGIATPFVRIVTGGMVSDPVIGVQAAWRGQPALFEISLNVDETGRGGYTFRVEPRDSVFQIVENGTVLVSSGFDVSFFAGTHQITFSAEGTALIVEVDGNIHLEATAQEVLPPGPTGLHVDARNPDGRVSIDWLFICGR